MSGNNHHAPTELSPSNEQLRVAHFINALKRPGGAESLLITLAQTMPRAGAEMTIVTIRENDREIAREIERYGVRVKAFPGNKLFDPIRFSKLTRFVRTARFDVIHTHLTGATILGTAAGKLCGVPVVATLHNTDMASQRHAYHGHMESWLLKHTASRVIAVGDRTAAAHQRRLAHRVITVIPNAVPIVAPLSGDERRIERQRLTGHADGCILVWAGRLTEQKGLLDLLEAFAILRRTRNDIFLVIVGDGPLAEVLKARTTDLRLADSVRFTGLRHDVPRLLAASDVYVSAAHWEGLPVAMLEAMSASVAVVATAVGDVSVALDGGAGILVRPRAPAELAEAVAPLVADVELRRKLGAAAKSRVEAVYGADAWAHKLRRVYEQVTTKGCQARCEPTPV